MDTLGHWISKKMELIIVMLKIDFLMEEPVRRYECEGTKVLTMVAIIFEPQTDAGIYKIGHWIAISGIFFLFHFHVDLQLATYLAFSI